MKMTSVLKSPHEKMRRSNSRPTPGMQRECHRNAGLGSTPTVRSGDPVCLASTIHPSGMWGVSVSRLLQRGCASASPV